MHNQALHPLTRKDGEKYSHRSKEMVSYSWYGHSVVALSHTLEETDLSSASLSKASRSRRNSSLEILMQHVDGFLDQIDGWTFADWKECLMNGTDKVRFEYFWANVAESDIWGETKSFWNVSYRPKNCKAMCKFLTCGQISFIMWDHHGITGP